MSETLPAVRELNSDEQATLSCNFAARLAEGETVETGTAVVVDLRSGEPYAPGLIGGTSVVDGAIVVQRVGNTKPRSKYWLIWRGVTSTGDQISEHLDIEANR